jgi:hypothetical protein
MDLLSWLPMLAVPAVLVFLVRQRDRERARNAPLRSEIEAQVCFATTLDRASKPGTGGFGVTVASGFPCAGRSG